MKTRNHALVMAILVPLLAVGCAKVQAKAAFKDGNKLYKEENFKKAIEEYEKAIQFDPGMAEAYFYLGSSNQALFRPGRETPENKEHLDKAIEHYKKSLEVNKADSEMLKTVKNNTLGALTGIYSEEPFRNFEEAVKYARQLVQDNPNDPKNLFAMANLYEKFNRVAEAEETYRKAAEQNPQDVKACNALAAFYNKPLWEGRSKFDQAIDTLQRCAALAPDDPSGLYKVATFYWDKAYRDPMLDDPSKDQYADKGLEFVDKALGLKPDYWEAIITKGLLYRVKAQVSNNPRLRLQYLDQAQTLQKQALELRKEQQQAGVEASPSPSGGE
jgi:tetratricopeptide (TPR) repeat protein